MNTKLTWKDDVIALFNDIKQYGFVFDKEIKIVEQMPIEPLTSVTHGWHGQKKGKPHTSNNNGSRQTHLEVILSFIDRDLEVLRRFAKAQGRRNLLSSLEITEHRMSKAHKSFTRWSRKSYPYV